MKDINYTSTNVLANADGREVRLVGDISRQGFGCSNCTREKAEHGIQVCERRRTKKQESVNDRW
jgi:hypothetical protein